MLTTLQLSPHVPQCSPRILTHRALPPICEGLQQRRHESTAVATAPSDTTTVEQELQRIRLPRAVQATYLDPLRHEPTHGIKTAQLQLRSYSIRNLEAFADFAMRAAYFLGLPARGPSPLPRITERWTVPRSNFVHKKSQENFERVTRRRVVTIVDGHPETVAAWLGFLQQRRYYGVGLKAHVWDFSGLEVGKTLDQEAEKIGEKLGEHFELVGGRRSLMSKDGKAREMVEGEPLKAQWGAYAAMSGAQSVPNANKRIETKTVE